MTLLFGTLTPSGQKTSQRPNGGKDSNYNDAFFRPIRNDSHSLLYAVKKRERKHLIKTSTQLPTPEKIPVNGMPMAYVDIQLKEICTH